MVLIFAGKSTATISFPKTTVSGNPENRFRLGNGNKANKRFSIKDNRLVPVDQDSILKMPANGSGQHELFQISPFLDKVLGSMAMTDTRNILLDDRSLV